ncbi:MAG: class I mannose-6-phosphate isomerase [Bacteroidales bacterium]|nr:class I mannose-6-phosphate isomerase [Bacteroidales bacterium]
MNQFSDNKSNYDKYPVVNVPNKSLTCFKGWQEITEELDCKIKSINKLKKIIVIECYQGVYKEEIKQSINNAFPEAVFFDSEEAMISEKQINEKFRDEITDDEIFGHLTTYSLEDFFSRGKVANLKKRINKSTAELIFIYGTGAAYIQDESDLLIYIDMARWEIQMRFRRNEINNLGVSNLNERPSIQYKRAFFVDWRVCDKFKKKLMRKWDYIFDTNTSGHPKMISGKSFWAGMEQAIKQPIRVVPFFDPGPWGGQWMKEICDLDKDVINYAWCFDCVPEENSLLLGFGDTKFETPSINLVFAFPSELLGNPVHARFGDEFPIRFDFLDTMNGGNLSLQVHPLTEYIQEKFGIPYTQDESYYMLDANDDAVVFLGLKDGVVSDEMISDLIKSQNSGKFDVEKYVGKYKVKKHDHVLIPAGTVHCSGANSMVLEISATPYIFTFKLWDWNRLGLDGRPRPINIEHGKNAIQWERTESYVKNQLINQVVKIGEGDGWIEEKTGLHEREFIETRRHSFSKSVLHKTNGSVNVLNLVEGREIIIESPSDSFDPFVIHYAETFIIPEYVKEYTIRPFGESIGKECATIKAYIRTHA